MKKDVRQTPISCNPASAPSQSQVTGSNTASASSTSASPAPHAASYATLRSQTTSPHATQPANATPPENVTQPPQPAAVGTFTCLYESKDKKYCLFADENGHLTSVKAHRLS